VVEAFRRRGVARELMQAAVGHARATGARSLALLTEETNAGAQRLYESMGWMWDTTYRRYTLVVDG
jgi:ribosomal protein S18 acetylase RimI-like enzyme